MDEIIRELERLAEHGDPVAIRQYLEALRQTSGYTVQQIEDFARQADLRQVQRVQGEGGRLAAMVRQMFQGGANPNYQVAAQEFRSTWQALATRGSEARWQLAQFLRDVRNNPYVANHVNQILRYGSAGSVPVLARVAASGAALRATIAAGLRTAAGAALGAARAIPIPAAIAAVLAAVLIAGILAALLGEDPEERRRGAINCDCTNINAGILNVGWIPHCQGEEQALREAAARGEFELVIEDGKVAGGPMCSSISGPGAWPVMGASETPPPPPADRACNEFTGLVQDCG